jgi:hypothetical protein
MVIYVSFSPFFEMLMNFVEFFPQRQKRCRNFNIFGEKFKLKKFTK